jgi:TPR repeat protein
VAGSQAFSSTSAFNANIGGWNTASVSNMKGVCELRPLGIAAAQPKCGRGSGPAQAVAAQKVGCTPKQMWANPGSRCGSTKHILMHDHMLQCAALRRRRGTAGTLGTLQQQRATIERWSMRSLKEIRAGTERGDVVAMFELARAYKSGDRGVRMDHAAAARWLRPAAEAGLAEAQNSLGYCCDAAEGVPQDQAEAFRLYGLAAAQGLSTAVHNLACSYSEGSGCARDHAAALACFKRAAAQGNADSMGELAVSFRSGRGVAVDLREATRWAVRAAQSGSVAACNLLGEMSEAGEGCAPSATEACAWWARAAGMGHPSLPACAHAEAHLRRLAAAGAPEAETALRRLASAFRQEQPRF